jgi:hypothetical protein
MVRQLWPAERIPDPTVDSPRLPAGRTAMAQPSDAQLRNVLGMLRGIDEIIEGTASWTAGDLRKIASKVKSVAANVEQRIATQREAPKQSMSYYSLVETITAMIR